MKHHYHLVGIKGVAMTALAAILLDDGQIVTGSDVAEDFVTATQLQNLGVRVQVGFEETDLPASTQIVVFSGANGGSHNPQVQAAKLKGLPTYSHMEMLAQYFNKRRGIAVCGVGGKSTISGMLAFVSEKVDPQSYAVGVGEILGLKHTGKYRPTSKWFIAEADEYVVDPSVKTPLPHTRMSYLHPQVIVCSNLKYDHPDVYADFEQTKQVYRDFFLSLSQDGAIIYNGDDDNLTQLVTQVKTTRPDLHLVSYGDQSAGLDYQLSNYNLKLQLPGRYNQLNALAALAVGKFCGWEEKSILDALSQYRSVKRRMENIGEINGVTCWDDYAHHPSEIKAAIAAIKDKYHRQAITVVFQPHTFSRTKSLLVEFATALATNERVLLLDIFPSAREASDPTISSDILANKIKELAPTAEVINLKTIAAAKDYLHQHLKPGEIFLTLGAGDIYQIYS